MSANHRKLETLVNRKLDGTLTPEEQRELDRMVAEDPEARRYLEEMDTLDASLRQVPREEAPPGLSDKVMDKIRGERKTGKGGLIRNLHEQSRRMLRYAAILFIGLVLGAAATILFTEDRSLYDTDEMVGSMTARAGQKLAFSQDDWQLQVNPMRVDNLLILVFSAASDDLLDVSIGYDATAYRLNKSRFLGGPDVGSRIRAGAVSFEIQDRVHYQLVLEAQPGMSAPFELTVYQDGQIRYNRELVFP